MPTAVAWGRAASVEGTDSTPIIDALMKDLECTRNAGPQRFVPEMDDYHCNGWTKIPGLLRGPDLGRVRDWLISCEEVGPEVPTGLQPQFESDNGSSAPRLRKIRRLFWHAPGFWTQILERAGIFDLARVAIGGAPVLILHAAFLKPALIGTAVTPHQDQAFWDFSYPGAVTVWVAVSPATEQNGCLSVYPGSHERGLLPHRPHPSSPWHEMVDPSEHGIVPRAVLAEPGDAICWQRYMVHSSAPNRSALDRKCMVLVFADANETDFQAIDEYRLPKRRTG